MRRRSWIAVPGIAALAASRAFSEPQEAAPRNGTASHVSRKALASQSGTKGSYELPKNAAKQAKLMASLTALLSLTPTQQQQAAAIFTNAVNSRIGIHATMKSARKELSAAVQNYDGSGIAQAAAQIGALMTQYVSNGALANAAVFHLLTPDQQTKYTQFLGQSPVEPA